MLTTHVAIVLDRSGSMYSIRDATIEAFNQQVSAVKEVAKDQKRTVSLFTFSSDVDEPLHFATDVSEIPQLTSENYRPDGGTALNDAVLEATRRLGNLPDANDSNTAFLVIIISDGDENNSKNSGEDVRKRLEVLQNTRRWTFTYLGCSEADLTRMRDLGIFAGNSRLYRATPEGVAESSVLRRAATADYFCAREEGHTSVENLYGNVEGKVGLELNQTIISTDLKVDNIVSNKPIQYVTDICSRVVGLTEDQANKMIEETGRYAQVDCRDGVGHPIPALLDSNRVCLTIENDRVIGAEIG